MIVVIEPRGEIVIERRIYIGVHAKLVGAPSVGAEAKVVVVHISCTWTAYDHSVGIYGRLDVDGGC